MLTFSAETAALLLVGNELLSGKTQEANLQSLAKTLRAVGVRLCRAHVIPDHRQEVADEIRALSSRYDLVFTSGGVGPTHDDVTLEAVADAFGVKARAHPDLDRMLRDTYGPRFTEGHLRMALVPEGAELLRTEEVTWPTVVLHNVWVLPGVPEIFRMKLSVVRAFVRGPVAFHSRQVYTQLDEGALKPLLDRVVSEYASVEIGSYPKLFDPRYKTKVTFDGSSSTEVEAATERFIQTLPPGEPQALRLGDE